MFQKLFCTLHFVCMYVAMFVAKILEILNCRVVDGVVRSDDIMSQILSGKLQPTDTVENVMVKGFKVVSVHMG